MPETSEQALFARIRSSRVIWEELNGDEQTNEARHVLIAIRDEFLSTFRRFEAERKGVPFVPLRELKCIGCLIPTTATDKFNEAFKLTDVDLSRYPLLALIAPPHQIASGDPTSVKLRFILSVNSLTRNSLSPDFKFPESEIADCRALRSFLACDICIGSW